MGSTGSGRFSNYGRNHRNGGSGNGNGSGNESNDGIGNEICTKTISSVRLEDIESQPYYQNINDVPSPGDDIFLSSEKYRGRLVVIHDETRFVLGNVPVEYNYLYSCMQAGFIYTGKVIATSSRPLIRIVVNLDAQK